MSAEPPKACRERSTSVLLGKGVAETVHWSLRAIAFGLWVLLATLTPLLTTILVAVALLGGLLVLFFDALLHLQSFHAGPILAVSGAAMGLAALLNVLVNRLAPR